MKKVVFSLALLTAFTLKSQTTSVCDSTNWAKEGTYDVIPLSKVIEVFTTETLCVIETNRKDFETVELLISPLTMIRIHPRRIISEGNPVNANPK